MIWKPLLSVSILVLSVTALGSRAEGPSAAPAVPCVAPTLADVQALVSHDEGIMAKMRGGAPAMAAPDPQTAPAAFQALSALLPTLLDQCAAHSGAQLTMTDAFDASSFRAFYFGVSWTVGQDRHSRYWTAAPASLAVTGPTEDVYGAAADAFNSNLVSKNYAGERYYELDAVGNAKWLSSDWLDITVPTITTPTAVPTNVPAGYYVDPAFSIWVGITPNSDGTGGLVQTGIAKDTRQAALGNYNLWYENYPTLGRTYFSGSPTVPPGHYNWQEVWQCIYPVHCTDMAHSNNIVASQVDSTTGNGWSAWINAGVAYQAHYAWNVAETFSVRETPAGKPVRNVFTQVPKISTPIAFYDTYACTADATQCESSLTCRAAGGTCRYDTFQIKHTAAAISTTNTWNAGTGGFSGGTGYFTAGVSSSAYDFTYVNGP